ncbi:hypothetical protein [Acidimangrovimonas sediminis]|uniref:hypothetical protein n=1 Tax=Acidimangrovimonas sediminis TaxID=2056283 RepID=UPI0011AF6258|nr:hypothetical protein [Acidimangrovimonas sediminis]
MKKQEAAEVERAAKEYVLTAASSFTPVEWWGPIADALGFAVGLSKREMKIDGAMQCYYVMSAPGGPALLRRAAAENRDAFLFTKYIVASYIQAGQSVPTELRDFAAQVLTGTIAVPAEKTGPKDRDHWSRDVFLYFTARALVREFGLQLTRVNRRGYIGPRSACELLYEALADTLCAGLKDDGRVQEICEHRAIWGKIDEACNKLGPWFLPHLETVAANFRES